MQAWKCNELVFLLWAPSLSPKSLVQHMRRRFSRLQLHLLRGSDLAQSGVDSEQIWPPCPAPRWIIHPKAPPPYSPITQLHLLTTLIVSGSNSHQSEISPAKISIGRIFHSFVALYVTDAVCHKKLCVVNHDDVWHLPSDRRANCLIVDQPH